jgi:membrane protease YdiL (CAAX protease family)
VRQSIEGGSSAAIPRKSRLPLIFILLVFVLSVPFLVIGAVTGLQLLPGIPVAALAFVCPGLAAVILVYRESRAAGVKALLRRSFDNRRITSNFWYLPIVLLMPIVSVLSFGVQRLIGVPVPSPQIAMAPTLGLLLVCFVAALGEELGWSGYALEPLQDRYGALWASLILGLVWAVWHLVPLVQAHRGANWIAWWCLGTVALRVVMVWLYNHTGKSVFAMALLHAMVNVSWQSFPIHGSYFDPRIDGLIMLVVAAAVIIARRPRSLSAAPIVEPRNRRAGL